MSLPCEEWKKKVKGELSNGRQNEGSRTLFTSIVIFVFLLDLDLAELQEWSLYVRNWNWNGSEVFTED